MKEKYVIVSVKTACFEMRARGKRRLNRCRRLAFGKARIRHFRRMMRMGRRPGFWLFGKQGKDIVAAAVTGVAEV